MPAADRPDAPAPRLSVAVAGQVGSGLAIAAAASWAALASDGGAWRWLVAGTLIVAAVVWSAARLRGACNRVTAVEAEKSGVEQRLAAASAEADTVTRKLAAEVADRRRVEQAMREAREAAEKAARIKGEFLANMSHEIRTPMNGMLGMTELLLNSELTRKQKHFAETIHRSGEHLLAIINDILDFSKIEAGKLQLHETAFDLRVLLEEVVDLFAERAHRKNLELANVFPADLHLAYHGDVYRLQQIIANLLGNAIKFTERGEVVLKVAAAGAGAERTTLRVEVSDTGVGLKPDAVPRLFEAFSQADASTTRQHGGTGLGLAICKRLVSLMGGEIGVDSSPGRGSTFWFTVRLRKAQSVPGVDHVPAAALNLQGVRVLIVDDNATSREALAGQLRAWGMNCDPAADGKAALQALKVAAASRDPYEIAIFDRGMPGMNGIELVRQVKATPEIADMQLIMMTAIGDLEESGQWIAIGVDAYLDKPLRQLELQKCLIRVLGRQDRTSRLAPVAEERQEAPRFKARVLLAEDNLVNQELAVTILEMAGCRVQVVGDGKQAVEAIADSPLDLLRDPYDLVLMDCQMPVMDGYSATGAIRKWEAASKVNRRLPIVALTANALEGDREKCLQAGMDDYLPKPFTQAQLFDKLKRWLPLQALTLPPPAAAAAPKAEPATGPTTALDQTVLDRVRALQKPGGPDVLGRIIGLFLEHSPQHVTGMQAAAAAGDAEKLRLHAHTLKSSAANLGATALAEHCWELEQVARAGKVAEAGQRIDIVEFEYQGVCAALRAELDKRAAA
jgi:signal transduction histidine kinase/DNA-binding response OmpR family regulator